ncbi:MAG: hypothetical protein HY775_04725 [Acidobacteria bacterium]|nr:hypothetical protein [Acidobacteriota bacterium]
MRGRPAPGRRPPARLLPPAALGTVAALFVVIGANVLVGQAAVTRAALEVQVRGRRVEAERLEVTVARLRAPERIEKRALDLGLVPASEIISLVPPVAGPPMRGARD